MKRTPWFAVSRARSRAAELAVVLLVLGCGPRERVSLVDLEAFVPTSGQASDPFREHYDDPTCEADATGFELFGSEPSFGVDAERCLFLTASTPALSHVDESELLHLRIWHFELSAPTPTTATVALALDGRIVWEHFLEIPGPSGLDAPYFDAPFAIEAGAAVDFHVRNHGRNSYSLLEVSVGGERP